MAFYHVGGCDCGTEYVYFDPWRNDLLVVTGRRSNLVPERFEYLGDLNGPYEARIFEDSEEGRKNEI